MSAKQTTKVISDILNNAPDGVAVLYSGTTGIGKTYDWFHFISPALKADKKYYVSLSGISDTAGIRNALLGDYFRQNEADTKFFTIFEPRNFFKTIISKHKN